MEELQIEGLTKGDYFHEGDFSCFISTTPPPSMEDQFPPLPLSHHASPVSSTPAQVSVGSASHALSESVQQEQSSHSPRSNPATAKAPLRISNTAVNSESPWTGNPIDAEGPIPLVTVVNGTGRIHVPDEVIADQQPLWSDCIIGFFLNDPPDIAKVHATINRIWRRKGDPTMIDAHFLTPTSVLLRIPNASSRQWVLNKRFWHIGTVPLVVQSWNPRSSNAAPNLTSIPIWVDLKGVPDHLFTRKGLKFLGDGLGKFVKLHPTTEKCYRLDVARIMVSVNLEETLLDQLALDSMKDNDHIVEVVYPWIPTKCKLCSQWGHDANHCSTKETIQEQVQEETETREPMMPGSVSDQAAQGLVASETVPAIDTTMSHNAPAIAEKQLDNPSMTETIQQQFTFPTNNDTANDLPFSPNVDSGSPEEGEWQTVKTRYSPSKTQHIATEQDTTNSLNGYQVLANIEEEGEIPNDNNFMDRATIGLEGNKRVRPALPSIDRGAPPPRQGQRQNKPPPLKDTAPTQKFNRPRASYGKN